MDNTQQRVQLHLVLAYKHEAAEHPQVRRHLDQGYDIVQLQRVTDQEVLITLERN